MGTKFVAREISSKLCGALWEIAAATARRVIAGKAMASGADRVAVGLRKIAAEARRNLAMHRRGKDKLMARRRVRRACRADRP